MAAPCQRNPEAHCCQRQTLWKHDLFLTPKSLCSMVRTVCTTWRLPLLVRLPRSSATLLQRAALHPTQVNRQCHLPISVEDGRTETACVRCNSVEVL